MPLILEPPRITSHSNVILIIPNSLAISQAINLISMKEAGPSLIKKILF